MSDPTGGGKPGTRFEPGELRALLFDVFGTVVDWRSSVIREGEALGERLGIEADWTALADAWRGLYQPAMQRVRDGERPWVPLDVLHRESLDALLARMRIEGLAESDRDWLNRAWHRLTPWPDSVPGLERLKRRYIIATCSNGNVALMVDMAKNAGLPWDMILGAEPTLHYKPQPRTYLGSAALLGLEPARCMMVAAHNDDLRAARALGFRTAFVARPGEYGPHQSRDFEAEEDWDVVAGSMTEIARRLGC